MATTEFSIDMLQSFEIKMANKITSKYSQDTIVKSQIQWTRYSFRWIIFRHGV